MRVLAISPPLPLPRPRAPTHTTYIWPASLRPRDDGSDDLSAQRKERSACLPSQKEDRSVAVGRTCDKISKKCSLLFFCRCTVRSIEDVASFAERDARPTVPTDCSERPTIDSIQSYSSFTLPPTPPIMQSRRSSSVAAAAAASESSLARSLIPCCRARPPGVPFILAQPAEQRYHGDPRHHPGRKRKRRRSHQRQRQTYRGCMICRRRRRRCILLSCIDAPLLSRAARPSP